MSLESVLARVAELQSAATFAPPAPAPANAPATARAAAAGTFANVLQSANATAATAAPGSITPPGAGGASALLSAVQGEVGQAESPPGSNDSPRIAEYRAATAGAPGP